MDFLGVSRSLVSHCKADAPPSMSLWMEKPEQQDR